MIRLDDRIVLITGAAGGIGTALSETVVAGGGKALLHDVDRARVEALAARLGPSAVALTADLSDIHATDALWDEALAVHGRIDVLVNNAGIYPAAPTDLDLDAWIGVWNRSLSVNLVAPAVLCRRAVATYAGQEDGGVIVNLASRAAFRGEDAEYWHYSAAKAGVVGLTKTLARQYGRDGVSVFAIAPGYVDTSFNEIFRDTVGVEVAAADTGLGRVAQPQDIANVIAFLATGLATHATGTTIDVNGASYVH